MQKPIIVVGAGIVGVSTAIWLQRAGKQVVLIDKDGPAAGASFGNAGLLASWAIVPVNTPEIWADGPKFLINPNSPLFLKWAQFPTIFPWLTRFLSHATSADTARRIDQLAPLLSDTVEQHRALAAGTKVEGWVHNAKCGFAYPDRRAFDRDAYSWGFKRRAGLVPTLLSGRQVQEEEPILGPDTGFLAVISGQGHITDPGGYVAQLVDHFTAQDGTYVQAELRDIHRTGGQVTHIDTDRGPMDCTSLVITAGIWSGTLTSKLGIKVPMLAERGYHVVFENPSRLPRNPLLMAEGKFGVNPMDMGLRCAGTVELGDHHAPASDKPIRLLREHAARAFPDLRYTGTSDWMGFRPTTVDALPLIGQIGDSRVYTGFGHQHIGLTAGPKTGRLLAQMITGASPNADLSGFAPERFGAVGAR